MKIYLLALVLTGINVCRTQNQYRREHCSSEEQGTLDWRVRNSEVVITGTIAKIESENSRGEDTDEFDIDQVDLQRSPNQPGRQAVGLVKLWSVIKGTVEHVKNVSFTDQGLSNGMNPPVIKLYGLWNDYICGSFLNVGDTRIFFLRKLRDARPSIDQTTNETTSLETRASAYLGQLTSSVPTADDDLSLGSVVEKSERKKKRGKRGKRRGRKRSRNGERRKKGRKGRKKRGRRKRKTTESMYQSLRMLRRHTRDLQTPHSPTNRQSPQSQVEVRDRQQVLVVASPPARITLENLKKIEGFVELE